MKKNYLLLFMVFSLLLSAQDTAELPPSFNEEISGFKLYPNPAYDDFVYINTTNNARKEIVVYDVFGKVVLTERIQNTRLNISRLVPGVYVLQVTEAKKSITRKLVVK